MSINPISFFCAVLGMCACVLTTGIHAQSSRISAGELHSLAIKADGTIWAWGANDFGMLGDGTDFPDPSPVQVLGMADAVSVTTGLFHSAALKSDGMVWAWGDNSYGQLGNGTWDGSSLPVQADGLQNVIAIVSGWRPLKQAIGKTLAALLK